MLSMIGFTRNTSEKPIPRSILLRKLSGIRKSAKKRGYICSLTLANVERLLRATHCEYTGVPFENLSAISFERIDNSVGYVPGNVIPVISFANQIKSGYTVEELEDLKETFKNKHNNKLKSLRDASNGLKRRIKSKERQIADLQRVLEQDRTEFARTSARIEEVEAGNSEHMQRVHMVDQIVNHMKTKPFSGHNYMTLWQKVVHRFVKVKKTFTGCIVLAQKKFFHI